MKKQQRATKLYSLVLIPLLLLMPSMELRAQGTTYTQAPTRVCLLNECVKAEFNPQALLSYYLPAFQNVSNQTLSNQYAYWCTGSLTCTQVEYRDFDVTMTRTYHGIDPQCPVSDQCWYMHGSFNGGRNTVDKKWECFRSCGSANDIQGSVTVQ